MPRKKTRLVLTPGWIMYLRTSDEEVQAPERSQSAQRRDIEKRLAAGIDLPYLNTYVDNFTGTSADRKHYQQMLADARHGKFSHIYAQIPDRFGRDDVEALGIKVRFALQPELDPANEDDRFYLNILFGTAKRESRVTARRTQGGMLSKLMSGGWPVKAPDGYLNKEIKLSEVGQDEQLRHARYKRWVELDPQQAPVWREAWALLLENQYTLDEICEHLHGKGYRLKSGRPFVRVLSNGTRIQASQVLSKAFRNWFYAGWAAVDNSWGQVEPKTIRGDWEPMVTTEAFERGLAILAGNDADPMPRKRYTYLLQGLIALTCADGNLVNMACSTANPNRPGGGTRHYRNADGTVNFNCGDVDGQISHHLLAIQIDPELIPRLRRVYLADVKRFTSRNPEERKQLETRLKKLDEKEVNLWRNFTENAMPPHIHQRLTEEMQEERRQVSQALDGIIKESQDGVADLEVALRVISEIADRYAKLTATQQRDILKLLVKRVIVNERGIVTRLELQPPFQYLVSLGNGGDKQRNPAKKTKTFRYPYREAFRILDILPPNSPLSILLPSVSSILAKISVMC